MFLHYRLKWVNSIHHSYFNNVRDLHPYHWKDKLDCSIKHIEINCLSVGMNFYLMLRMLTRCAIYSKTLRYRNVEHHNSTCLYSIRNNDRPWFGNTLRTEIKPHSAGYVSVPSQGPENSNCLWFLSVLFNFCKLFC